MPSTSPALSWSSADFDAMVEHVAPAILTLLADGVPRPRRTILQALAGQHAREDLVCTLMRLAVTGQLLETDRKYRLPGSGR